MYMRKVEFDGFDDETMYPISSAEVLYDIGDIVGIKGKIFCTKTGEVTVHANSVELLCKSLQPLPEKYHDLRTSSSAILGTTQ